MPNDELIALFTDALRIRELQTIVCKGAHHDLKTRLDATADVARIEGRLKAALAKIQTQTT